MTEWWPQKQLHGEDEEEPASFEQALPEEMQPDFTQEMLDVYGDHVFMQAERAQGVDAFCSEDPSLAVNPNIDLPFEVFPAQRRMFRNRDLSYKGHPDMKTILDAYDEGRQAGNLEGMVFNIPCGTLDEVDYFGRIRKQNVPCDPDHEAALNAALEGSKAFESNARGAGSAFAQDVYSYGGNDFGTRTPSSLADRTPA